MRLVAAILVVTFFLTGCSSMKTYTFKRARVDQDVQEGNRGYLEGTPPPAEDRSDLKRTMYGVDIEIPLMPWEKQASIPPKPSDEKVEVPPMEDEKTIFEVPAEPAKRKSPGEKEAMPEKDMTIKGERVREEDTIPGKTIKGEDVDEEEWIK